MAESSYSLAEGTFAPFLASDLRIKPATETWERRDYYALRQAVFSAEQRLLAQDKDEKDFQAIPIVALAHTYGQPDRVVGAVRIYQPEPGLWYGGRLCVEHAYRRHGLIGKALVNEAVSLAIELGCRRFLATVQAQNERYFQGLHWHTLERTELLDKPHCLMQADLQRYPFMPRRVSLQALKVRRHD